MAELVRFFSTFGSDGSPPAGGKIQKFSPEPEFAASEGTTKVLGFNADVNVPYDHSFVATSELAFQLPARLKVSACDAMLSPKSKAARAKGYGLRRKVP